MMNEIEDSDRNSHSGGPPTMSSTMTTTQVSDRTNRIKSRNKERNSNAGLFGSNKKDFEGAQASIG